MGNLSALPALNAAPPPDPLASIGKLLAIKSMLGQQQTQQLQQTALGQENEQRSFALQDQQTLRSLAPNHVQKDDSGKITGFDTNGLLQEAAGKGVSPQTLNKMRLDYADAVQKTAAAGSAQIELENKKNDQAYQILEGIRGIKDPAQRQTAYQQAAPKIQALGIDTSTLPQTADDAAIQGFEAHLGVHKQILADAETAAKTNESNQKAEADVQTAAAKKQEALWYQQHPGVGAPGVPAEQVSAADWLAKNPDKTFSDYTIAMKKVVPAFQFNLQNNSGAGKPSADVAKQFGMSPEAFDQAAEKYYQSGTLPALGRGAAGPALQKAIMNRTAELHPGASLAAGSAEYAANKASLKQIQETFDAVNAFENTAGKNLDVFLNQAKKIVDTGSPLINRPIRSVTKELAGSENMAAFDAARTTALTEIAKVLNSPKGAGVLSDSARSEVEGLIGKDATLKQIVSAANILKQDMANRHQSYQQQIQDIQGRMGGKPPSTTDGQDKTTTHPFFSQFGGQQRPQ